MEDSVRRLIPREQRPLYERGPGNGAELTAIDSRASLTVQIAALSNCGRRYASVHTAGP